MSGTASSSSAAGTGAARAAVPTSAPTAVTGLECAASPVHVYLPASAASTHQRGTVYRGKAHSDSPCDSRLPAEVASPPTYGGTRAVASPVTGLESVSVPATTTRGTSGTLVRTTAAAAGVVAKQHWLGERLSNRFSSAAAGGDGSHPTWGGTRRRDVSSSPASTPLNDKIQQMRAQEQAATSVAAAPADVLNKQGAGARYETQLSSAQVKQQQRRALGGGGVYARREKIHNLTMQTLQQRKGPSPVLELQRQQQRALLQEHLPAFFPAAQEGEQSEDAKKLHRVLAFQHSAAVTAAAEAVVEKSGEPLDWRKATVAMTAFGIPQDAKRMLKGSSSQHIHLYGTADQKQAGPAQMCEQSAPFVTDSSVLRDDDRWRRAFPRTALPTSCPLPADSQFFLFMALVAEGSRRYEEADAYVVRMLVANALQKKEIPPEQRTCMQKIISRRLRHQRNLWKQSVALEQALQTRQNAVEDRLSSGSRLEKTLQLDEVIFYKQRLKAEIIRHCYGVIWAATNLLKPFAVTAAGRLFVHKTIAAAYRQATQYTVAVSQYQCLELARDNYEIAVELAKSNVGSPDLCEVTRLEVLISWANFLFYNMEQHKLALQEGRRTLQEALYVLPTIKENKKFDEVVDALQTLTRSIQRWMQATQEDAVFDWWMG